MSSNQRVFSVVVFILCSLSGGIYAQQADQFLKKGDKALQLSDVEAADKFYAAGLAIEPDHVRANAQMGRLHLQQGAANKALPYLRKAHQLTRGQKGDLTFLLAQAYHLSYHFDSALTYYQVALRQTPRKDYDQQELLKKRLEECQAGAKLLDKPTVATVQNVGAPINSPSADHVPVLTVEGNMLIFTSRRSPGPGSKGKQKKGNENVYYSARQEGAWANPVKFSAPVNSTSHDAVIAVSADGGELFLYKGRKGGDLYVARKTPAGKWTEPFPLGEPFNSPAFEPSLAVSDDGQYAFFSSDREGGMGGLDLYLTFREPDGSWSEAMNLGPSINTPHDEDAPFIDSPNNILYFSSRGHNSMGGYDIFTSSVQGSLWSPAENLGLPINSPYDDIYFALTPDKKHGYFASDRPGGLGEKDIYLATLKRPSPPQQPTEPEEPEKVASEPFYVKTEPEVKEKEQPLAAAAETDSSEINKELYLEVVVVDVTNSQPLPATVTVYDEDLQEVITRKEGDSAQETITLPLGVEDGENSEPYRLLVERPGYFIHSDRLDLPLNSKDGKIKKTVALKKLAKGSPVVLRHILFAFNEREFRPEARAELDVLYRLLKLNPRLTIEISGHTDNQGAEEVNQLISEQRAKAVREYLEEKGIEEDRMRAVGYGFSRPLTSNATEEGRQRNRRTEFSVLGTLPDPAAATE